MYQSNMYQIYVINQKIICTKFWYMRYILYICILIIKNKIYDLFNRRSWLFKNRVY